MYVYVGVLMSCLVCMCAGLNYSYTDQGASWATQFEKSCAGKRQSPIDIRAPECDESLNNSLSFTNYDKAGSVKLSFENNGHSLKLSAPNVGAKISLGSGLGTYSFVQLHFHWGSDDKKGSEHSLNGKVYPAEMHLVHLNDKYSSFDVAKKNPDGLAVLGVFIQVGQENTAFNFLSSSNSIINNGEKVDVNQFALNTLLPTDKSVFYRYNGSLTTPACDEIVTWTVFDQPISLSANQLAAFRIVKDTKNKTMVNNYRLVQDLNDRKITYWDEMKCASGATVVGASIFSAIFSLLFFTL